MVGRHGPELVDDGHKLLNSIRDEVMWNAVKAKVAKVGGSVSVDLIKSVVGQIVKERLGLTE